MDFLEPLFFALLAAGVIGAGLAVVVLRRITAQALLMALSFASMAGMFLLLGAETIALFQVLIYVGAITILILFGVMFTKQDDRGYGLFFQQQTPWAAALYRRARDRGHDHPHAVRILARAWLHVIWRKINRRWLDTGLLTAPPRPRTRPPTTRSRSRSPRSCSSPRSSAQSSS